MPDFDPGAGYVPTGLRKAAKEALSLGWTAKKAGSGGWFLHSPKRTAKFYIPTTAKDSDALASKLRSLINKAYVRESGFVPQEEAKIAIANMDLVTEVAGAVIQNGPDPTLRCPDCDGEWIDMPGFLAHQEACQERVRAALAAEQPVEVPEEVSPPVEPSTGQQQESTEPAQSGTISTKEETLSEQSGVKPKAKRRSWTRTENDPVQRMVYLAIHNKPRMVNETESKWSLRLAEYIHENDLLDKIAPEVRALTDEDSAAVLLEQVRVLVGGGEELAGLKAQVERLEGENGRLRTTLTTLSELAREGNE